jgi:hypothetical protein
MLDSVFPPAPDSSDLSIDMGILNGFFRQVLSSEAYLATRIGLPFGLSVLALGRKPLDNK